ncbi:MAG: metal ABC transporter permease [Frankia sp.]|nr:metal ABC transporter permease [Frankia sp.]
MTDLLVTPFERPYLARALVELLLLGGLAAVVGVFVLLRRLAFLTDALTHTVFPGVVIGFLIGGQDGVFPGALVVAFVAAGLFTLLSASRRVGEDAALAILLTGFFAVGVVLVSRRSSYTADLTTFLFGRVLTVRVSDIVATAAVAVVVLAVLAALRKELLLVAFDPRAAQAAGYRVAALDLALNLAIALVVVAAVRAVGTVLVIALIVVPAATARLLSDRLAVVTAAAVGLGMAAGWIGLLISYHVSVRAEVRLATGATVVLVLVAAYLLALAFAGARAGLRRRAVAAAVGPGSAAGQDGAAAEAAAGQDAGAVDAAAALGRAR